MIKNILFIASVFIAGFTSAQTFQLMDDGNNDITGTSHYRYGTGTDLSVTKFHVKNISGVQATYKARVYEITNPNSTDLQVCFGTACYIANAGSPSGQTMPDSSSIAAGGIDTEFKVAPFSFAWVAGDSATWRVTVYNSINPSDSASAIITWKVNPTSVDEINTNDVSLNAYPNPASNNLTLTYSVDNTNEAASLDLYDVLGQKIKSYALLNNKGQLNLDVDNLNAGVYFYSIKVAGRAIKTERVIVK